jgi:hypothetical protein
MTRATRFDRLLGWYPDSWRERYGDELAALLEETYGERPIPLRQRASLLKGALVEHVHASGFSANAEPEARVRAGALLVLCSWAVFMVVGSAFAKYLEHWDLATPAGARWLPADAVDAVTWAAALAVALIALGALLVAVPVARSVRTEGWGDFGRAMGVAAVLVAIALAATGAVVLLASTQVHHSSPSRGGFGALGVWSLTLLAALAACVRAAIAAAGRVKLRGALLRAEASCALGVFLCMVMVLAGTATWWAAIALHAPSFLGTSLGPFGTWGSVAPPVMIGITGAMLVALLAAAAGAWRILGAHHSPA